MMFMQEPELLLEKRQQVERSIQSSALSHYHAFIDSANCLSVVQQQLATACHNLDDLTKIVPELAVTFEAFAKDAASIMTQHSGNKQMLGETNHVDDHTPAAAQLCFWAQGAHCHWCLRPQPSSSLCLTRAARL